MVFLRDGNVFLAKREGSHVRTLGPRQAGTWKWGETLEECARREALEELGVTVGDLRFLVPK